MYCTCALYICVSGLCLEFIPVMKFPGMVPAASEQGTDTHFCFQEVCTLYTCILHMYCTYVNCIYILRDPAEMMKCCRLYITCRKSQVQVCGHAIPATY